MADNVWIGGTTNWGTATNWSTGAVPTATDGNVVVFSGSSPACSLGSSNKVCNHLMMTGYTDTLTFGVRTLTVSGNITLGTAHTFSVTTGTLGMNGSGNLTTNGFIINTNLQFAGASQTFTLQDDVYLAGVLSLNSTGPVGSMFINDNGTSKKIYLSGGTSASATGVAGTAKLVIVGTGTISSTGPYILDMDINTSGTVTFGTAFRFSEKTLNYIAGNIDYTSSASTVYFGQTGGSGTTVNCSGITWQNVTTQATATINLGQDLYVGTQLTNTATVNYNGSPIHVQGILSLGGSVRLAGTSELYFDGSDCSWIAGTGILSLTSFIRPTGTFTLGPAGVSNCNLNNTTLTYVSGNTVTTNSTLDVWTAGATLNLSGMSLEKLRLRQGTTTLLSDIQCNILLVGVNSHITFAGSYGWTAGTFMSEVGNRTITLQSGSTYVVTDSMALIGNNVSQPINLRSSATSNYAYLNLATGATCYNRFCNPTDIDSSGGRLVTTIKGTISVNTINWYKTNPDGYFDFF